MSGVNYMVAINKCHWSHFYSRDANKPIILSPSIIHLLLRSLSAANISVSKQNEMHACHAGLFNKYWEIYRGKYCALCKYAGWGNWMVCVFVEGLLMISLFDLSVFLAHKAVLIQVTSHGRPRNVSMQIVNLSHVEQQFVNLKKPLADSNFIFFM